VEACADGDLSHVKMLLDEDCPADAAEFDGRTGLMLATARCARLARRHGAGRRRCLGCMLRLQTCGLQAARRSA
jgi:hypothetical protein